MKPVLLGNKKYNYNYVSVKNPLKKEKNHENQMMMSAKSSPLCTPKRQLRTLRKSDSHDAIRTLSRVLALGLIGLLSSAYMPLVCLPIGIILITCSMLGIQVIAVDAKKQKFFASKFSIANDVISTFARCLLLSTEAVCSDIKLVGHAQDKSLAFVDVLLKNAVPCGVLLTSVVLSVYHGYVLALLKYVTLPICLIHCFTSKS